ncbi:putative metabolite transport protein [Acrodontium crateriforme]|uniref:Metabolite transport protein n=1 Tax=Acrodontium crateriforme TaxID=150365 RepID=A0AAQ3M9J2_9PEZI|nr:putative metabolite transport protein [Acrodontium crateriforme]
MPTSGIFRGLTPYFVYLLLIATLGPLLFGYHLAELNAPAEVITCVKKGVAPSTLTKLASLLKPTKEETSGCGLPQCIPMNPTQFGLITSFFTLGGLFGALSAGPITTAYGRLRSMELASLFASLGPIFEALAPNIGAMAIGRLISGLGAGAATVIVPIYISEIAPPGKKGFFGSFTQVMTNFGILIAQVLGLFLSRGQLWRVILGVGGAIALVQMAGLWLGGQESPRWMVEQDKPSRAKKILRLIRGPHADIEDEISAWGISEDGARDLDDEEEALLANEDRLQNSHPAEDGNAVDSNTNAAQPKKDSSRKPSPGFFAVLRDPNHRPAVLAVAMIMIAQQFTGINSIVMYGVSLLSSLLAANSALLNVFVALLNVIVTTTAAPLIDIIGRKLCLLISIGGMGTSSLLLAFGIIHSLPILSAVAVLAFVASFGLGLGPVPFLLASELAAPEAVGVTQSWALAANWIATFVVAQFFPVLNAAMGKGNVYFLFAGMAALFGCLVAWRVPETKGKNSVDEIWGRAKPVARVD